jgi:hypothetical protein
MKAEHRKELETNLLADRMGRLVERIKTRPQRRSMLLVLLAVVIGVVVGLWYVARRGNQAAVAERWYLLETGGAAVAELAGFQVGERRSNITVEFDNPGKAARLEVARYFLWDYGVKKLATPGKDSSNETPMDKIARAGKLYLSLLSEVEDEPEWKAEALYGLAIIEETNAVRDIKNLARAKEKYKSLATDLPTTGHGKLADKRHKELEANFAEATDFYEKLGRQLNIPREADMPGLPPLRPRP